jgi:hypothetical protein
MGRLMKRMSLAFAAGCFGAVISSVFAWQAGRAGLPKLLHVQMAPPLTPGYLYPRVVWGGLWGLLFLLTWPRRSWLLRGLLYSLGPTLAQLLYFLPRRGDGMLGLDLGNATPLFVAVYGAVWGVMAAMWLRALGERAPPPKQ